METVRSLKDDDTLSPFSKFESDDSSEDVNAMAKDFLSHVDNTFELIYAEFKKLHKNQMVMRELMNDTAQSLELKVTELQDDMGLKPTHLNSEFDASNLWGTVGIIANIIETVRDTHKSIDSNLDNKVKSEVAEARAALVAQ